MKKLFIILIGTIAVSLVLVIIFALTKKVRPGDTITVYYTIRLDNGTVYYTSSRQEPLKETMGEGKFISGFEEALIGMRIGEAKTVTIPPENAYGEYKPDLVGTVSRDRLLEGMEPVIGQRVSTEFRDGSPSLALLI